MRLSALKVFLDWDHRRSWLELHAGGVNKPGVQCWVKSMFHWDFWEAASASFRVLSTIVGEMLTDTAILTLMNMLRLRRASLHSCQDLRAGVASAVEEKDEEEAKADADQVLSIIFWTSCFGLSRSSWFLARQSCRAGGVTKAEVIFQTLERSFPGQSWGDVRPLSAPTHSSPWHPVSCWLVGGRHSSHLLQWTNLPSVFRPRLQSGFNSTTVELTECVIIRCFTETRMFGCEVPQCRLSQSTTNGKHREALFSALNFQIALNTHYTHKPDPETCPAYVGFMRLKE